MRRAWQWMRSSEASWKIARGPVAVARLEIGRLGWQMQDDFRLEWNEVEVDLMRGPPAMVQHWLAKSAASARMLDMGNKLGTDAALGVFCNPGPTYTSPPRFSPWRLLRERYGRKAD